MNTMLEMLASAHEADLHRESREQRMRKLATACRRRVFGVVRPARHCEPQTC